ncbi:Rv1355c family protein [Jiangella alkaliphila]|uniref:Nitroreductase family protein n=1 Tax=Jiangella alkaliphila TaxID=419479 RepID=A0A1H2I518_9ACTN|nr:Rv1355c family protein [Jiangella alkaliphila]SDU39262.1 Nitroreductase family protein [Jiangella alkaliphila]
MTHATDEAWRPIHVEDRQRLAALTGDPAIEVIDTIERQRGDLARLRPSPDAAHLDEPTRWYYYPWRRALVHLLGPGGFQALRSDRNRNKITAEEQRRLRRLSVGVVGLSVGHAIAYTLALESICGRIRLADFDHIELSNLNRIPGTVFDLGVNKAVVLARRIAELDPYLDVQIEPAGLDVSATDAFMEGLDLVVEECDSFDLKLAVREAARRRRIPLIMESNERGMLDIERYDVEPDRPLFHGLLGDVRPADLMGLSTHDKIPYVLRVLEPDELSAVMAASMTEVDETLSTWPQLGGDVSLGAATVAVAVRKLGLGEPLPSGRIRVDLEAMLAKIAAPQPPGDPVPAAGGDPAPEPAPPEAPAAVVHAARLAPSGGNTQPWRFVLDAAGLELQLDHAQTSTLDVAHRGSHVALGAALFNARVAAARHGILGVVDLFPDGSGSDAVARLRFGQGGPAELAALYEPMLDRVSNRHLTEPTQLPGDIVPALRQAALDERAEAEIVTDRSRLRELAELLGESDRLRYLTEHLHREMMRELRWPGVDPLDWGLDVRTLELDDSDLAKLAVARRADVMAVLARQDLGRALGEPTRDRVETTSGLVVVTVGAATPGDYVRGGQAAERVWIEAQRRGLAVQAMSPVFIFAVDEADYVELSPRYAPRLQALHRDFGALTSTGDRPIALVMRIGYAPTISVRSRRLPADRNVRTR